MNLQYLGKELWHHHNRTMVNILGIAVGVMLFVAINAVTAAYKEAVSSPFRNIGADLVVQVPEKQSADNKKAPVMKGIRLPFSNQMIPVEAIQKIAAIDGVDSTTGALLLWDFDKTGFRTILGIDESGQGIGPVKTKEWLKEGRLPDKEGEAVLEKHFAKFHHTTIGSSLAINGKDFKVVGLLEIKEGSQINSANIYITLENAIRLIPDSKKGVNTVYVRLKNPGFLDKVKNSIGRQLPEAFITSSDSFLELMGGISRISWQFSLIISFMAFIGAVFLIIKAMLVNITARTRDIGILKAIGWTKGDVQKQVMAEVMVQSVAGGITGLLLGYFVSYLLGFLSVPIITPWQMNLLPAMARETTAVAVNLPVHISAGLAFAALFLSIITGLLAGFFIGRRTLKMKPSEILRKL